MKAFVMLLMMSAGLLSHANSQVTGIGFLPAANQVVGFTAIKISNSEYTLKNGTTKLSLSSNPVKFNQTLAIGFSDTFTMALDLSYVNQGSSDLKVGTTTFTSDYKRKLQSPEVSFKKRLLFADTSISYLDLLGSFSPKGSDDDIQASDYLDVAQTWG